MREQERVRHVAFHDVPGQNKVAHMLKNALRSNRLTHAYIFSGPDRAGKRQMAMELAKALNCTNHSDDACNECTNCQRIMHGNFPDVHWIQPEGKTVKIEQIRSLQKNVSYHSVEASVKVFIVDAAETMTLQAANSMLKFLEEPVGRVVAVLLTENRHAVLPTILSRCQPIRFQTVAPEVIVDQLISEGIPQKTAVVAGKLANGLDDAREIAQGEWLEDAQKLVVTLAEAVNERAGQALIVIQEKLMKSEVGRHYLEYFLDLMILWYRDMLNIRLGCKQPLTFLEQSEQLKQHVTKWTEPRLIRAVEHMLLAKQELNQHVAPQLVLEGWVLSVQEG